MPYLMNMSCLWIGYLKLVVRVLTPGIIFYGFSSGILVWWVSLHGDVFLLYSSKVYIFVYFTNVFSGILLVPCWIMLIFPLILSIPTCVILFSVVSSRYTFPIQFFPCSVLYLWSLRFVSISVALWWNFKSSFSYHGKKNQQWSVRWYISH